LKLTQTDGIIITAYTYNFTSFRPLTFSILQYLLALTHYLYTFQLGTNRKIHFIIPNRKKCCVSKIKLTQDIFDEKITRISFKLWKKCSFLWMKRKSMNETKKQRFEYLWSNFFVFGVLKCILHDSQCVCVWIKKYEFSTSLNKNLSTSVRALSILCDVAIHSLIHLLI
jgi:hypothetical protein